MVVINSVEVFPLNIPFIRPFKISKGYVGSKTKPGEHVYLKITTSDGEVGWGEARPMPAWMYETMETVYTTLKKYVSKIIIGRDPFQINRILYDLDRALAPVVSSGQPFAKSAVDIALHDLVGKYFGTPIHTLLGGRNRDFVEMSALISGKPEDIGEYSREMWRKGYRCFKLKIMGDPEEDYRLIMSLKNSVPDGKIWLDANQAYTSYSFMFLLKRLVEIDGIVCVEQPVPTYDFHGLSRIVSKSSIPIAVDESLFTHYDLIKLVSMNALDALVLKVAKSGLKTSLKISGLAEAAGIALMGSGMTESGVGLSASIHLYSTLDIVIPVDTNGPQFLEDLIVKGLDIDGAKIRVPDKPGLGIEVDEEKIERYRRSIEI